MIILVQLLFVKDFDVGSFFTGIWIL
jgi:hypothetical protein